MLIFIQSCLFAFPLQEWWDGSVTAGPKTRTAEGFSEAKPALEILSWDQNSLRPVFFKSGWLLSKISWEDSRRSGREVCCSRRRC